MRRIAERTAAAKEKAANEKHTEKNAVKAKEPSVKKLLRRRLPLVVLVLAWWDFINDVDVVLNVTAQEAIPEKLKVISTVCLVVPVVLNAALVVFHFWKTLRESANDLKNLKSQTSRT